MRDPIEPNGLLPGHLPDDRATGWPSQDRSTPRISLIQIMAAARSAGYALVLAVAVFLLIAIFTNPVLP
jgi:hypothetical protein